jgi:hypothetical protein
VLEVYRRRPYDPSRQVVCMDESSKQLVGEVSCPIPAAPGHPLLRDDEYVRNGVTEIFREVEPLAGMRHVEVTETRTRLDWACFARDMLDIRYPDAEKVVLVMDNLNTHGFASFYEAFKPEEAKRLSERLEIHYTPKHGSWLNVAEIGLSMLNRQCLPKRIPDMDRMREVTGAWNENRNVRQTKVNWQFTCEEARIKLKRLYPKL